MRIAFVVHDYNRTGGHSRYVAELACRFSREHEVHVYANGIDDSIDSGIQFHKVPAWRANALTTILSFAASSIGRVPKGFDIVHCQGFCGPTGNVITSHRCNEAWHEALRLMSGRLTLRQSVFCAFTSSLERHLYKSSRDAQVVAISYLVKRDLETRYNCQSPITVIYHGVDLDTFSPATRTRFRVVRRASMGITPSEPIFLFVGNLQKGARQCIGALSRLESGSLLLVSRTPPGPYAEYARDCGVADRVRFLPPTEHIEEAYSMADAFLLPSLYDEFGMVITEAMACGLPVIVSRHTGASELIETGVNGLINDDPTDHEGLASQMKYLLADPERAAEIGIAARRTVEHYSWDSIARQTMEIYQRVAACRN
jgi:UDP-glucose:(heptosyl)LPS alpha-1,3-glucosyltransferase